MIEKVNPHFTPSHIDLAVKVNELVDAVNFLSVGEMPDLAPQQSDQTKMALDEIKNTLGMLEDAVGKLSQGARSGRKKKK